MKFKSCQHCGNRQVYLRGFNGSTTGCAFPKCNGKTNHIQGEVQKIYVGIKQMKIDQNQSEKYLEMVKSFDEGNRQILKISLMSRKMRK